MGGLAGRVGCPGIHPKEQRTQEGKTATHGLLLSSQASNLGKGLGGLSVATTMPQETPLNTCPISRASYPLVQSMPTPNPQAFPSSTPCRPSKSSTSHHDAAQDYHHTTPPPPAGPGHPRAAARHGLFAAGRHHPKKKLGAVPHGRRQRRGPPRLPRPHHPFPAAAARHPQRRRRGRGRGPGGHGGGPSSAARASSPDPDPVQLPPLSPQGP